ncbi:MAG: WecB/TagA/CpsF family glycosyltransferase [Bacteroidales bacterium]
MKIDLYNIKLDIKSSAGVIADCRNFFHSNRVSTLFFLNAHCFNVAQKEAVYRKAINESDLLLNDGIGISIACRMAGIKPVENLNGTDLIPVILSLAAREKVKIFLLGGKDGVAEKAAVKIKEKIPGIEIAGTESGYFSGNRGKEVINRINDSRADLLLLGMGVPKQELWAVRNKPLLKNVKLIIAGGAILDFISGQIKRAPLWVRRNNLEWLYRLYLEPGRLWKRYTAGNILFFYHLVKLKFFPGNEKKSPLRISKQIKVQN